MVGCWVLLAAATLGIDAGWEPLPSGGLEYIIQIEPSDLETLADGQVLGSDIPPELSNIRSYRIQIGTGELPRELDAAQEAPSLDSLAQADPRVAKKNPPEEEASPPFWGSAPRYKGDEGEELPEEETDEEHLMPDELEADPRSRPMVNPTDYRGRRQPSRQVDELDNEARHELGSPSAPRQAQSRSAASRATAPRSTPQSAAQTVGRSRADTFPRPIDESTHDDEPQDADGPLPGEESDAEAPLAQTSEPAKPWLPLTVTLLGLFASLGGNAYLGWLSWALRGRCRDLLEKVRDQQRRQKAQADGE